MWSINWSNDIRTKVTCWKDMLRISCEAPNIWLSTLLTLLIAVTFSNSASIRSKVGVLHKSFTLTITVVQLVANKMVHPNFGHPVFT